jgi:ABC-type branched-subunit amino acid transport system substrate-binding protein
MLGSVGQRALPVAVALTAGALALTGCGDTNNSAAAATSPKLTGAPIVLEVNASVTGPAPFPWILQGAKAAAAAINKTGGVKGRPVQIINCDDQFDPNRASDCARKATSQKVIAYVGAETTAGDAYIPIITKAGIPTIGNIPASKSDFASPVSFPIGSGALVELAGAGALMTKAGCTKIGVAYADSAAAKFAAQNYLGKGLSLGGQKISVEVAIPSTAVDVTPYASSLVSKGADCVSVVAPAGIQDKMIPALKQAEPNIKVFEPASDYGPDNLKKLGSSVENVYLSYGIAPPSTSNVVPGIKRFNTEVNAFGDNKSDRNEFMINAWATVHIVAEQLKKLPTISSASLVKQLNAGGRVDFSPVMPFDFAKPVDLFPGFRVFASSVYVAQVKGGKAVLLNNGTPVDLKELSALTL